MDADTFIIRDEVKIKRTLTTLEQIQFSSITLDSIKILLEFMY